MSIRLLVTTVSFALLLAPASGSILEEASSGAVSYQFDGDSHHDAPDTCAEASPEWSVPFGSSTDGLLVAPDDVADVFLVDVPAGLRGQRLQVGLAEATDLESLEVTAFTPSCGGSVLDAVNWPTPEPSPPAPAEGERQVVVEDADQPWHCRPDFRLFWVEVMPGEQPPATIHVAWTDGSERQVPMTDTHGSAHALYATDHALGTTLKGAWANLPADWDRRFVYVAGPCDAVDGGAVYGEPPATGPGSLAFTAVTPGLYAVQVTYRDVAEGVMPAPILPGLSLALAGPEPETGSLPETLGDGVRPQIPAPVMGPRSCHACIDDVEGAVEKIAYRVSMVPMPSLS